VISFLLFAAMSSSEALSVVLNTPGATSRDRYDEAVRIVHREAAQGKRLQQFVVGVTGSDEKLSYRYLAAARPVIRVMAEERNNPLAWYLLSMESNDLKLLERAAAGGNIQALNALGAIKLDQAGKMPLTKEAEKLKREAFECFKRSAMKLDPNALYNVGTCCMSGIGCPVNKTLALECFNAAAKTGHPGAMASLSDCYAHGDGTKKDSAASLLWSMKAKASMGDKSAKRWLEKSK
jgi:TPR repeat protein